MGLIESVFQVRVLESDEAARSLIEGKMKDKTTAKVETLEQYLARGGRIQKPDAKTENAKKEKSRYSFVKANWGGK